MLDAVPVPRSLAGHRANVREGNARDVLGQACEDEPRCAYFEAPFLK